MTSGGGTLRRAAAALRSHDFRYVLSGRLLSQLADGLFQAYLLDRVVFLSPDKQNTAAGVAVALTVLVIPYSVAGPFAGVFVDRWSRRRILVVTPLIRASAGLPLLVEHGRASLSLYVLALVVVSLDRFYLTTAGAVMPSVVPPEDLLVGNAAAGALGTVATFLGVLVGSQIAKPLGPPKLAAAAAGMWIVSGLVAVGIRSPLRTNLSAEPLLRELRRIPSDLAGGARRLAATPPALGGVTTVTVDQILFGVVTTLSVVVFRHRFHAGVASYGRIIGVGGAGLIIGAATVGGLESLGLTKPRIVGLAFAIGGLACVAAAPAIAAPSVLAVSFALGLAYPWKKTPVDTVVQETIPNRFRGRVFGLYDLGASTARVIGAAVAALVVPRAPVGPILAGVGSCYLVWALIAPRWLRTQRRVSLRFYAGGRGEQEPRELVVGGQGEPVEVLGSWIEERSGARVRRFRLRTEDSVLEVVQDGDQWRVERDTPVPEDAGERGF